MRLERIVPDISQSVNSKVFGKYVSKDDVFILVKNWDENIPKRCITKWSVEK